LLLGTDVDLMSLLYATDAAVQVMKEQGSGHRANTSSIAGRKSWPI
jgi:NADP-dependent 3-hydroxy acid dehydrogenase YdfG